MTDVAYKAILTEVPDLAAQLAGAIIPSSQPQDGQPKGNNRPDAARIVAIADLDKLMRELVDSIDFWWKATSGDPFEPLPAVDLEGVGIRRTPYGYRYTRVVSDDPLQAGRDAGALANIILGWWDEIEGHHLWAYWLESLDGWLVPAVRRLEVRKIRQSPRKCKKCGERDVWADPERQQAVCAQCGHQERIVQWLPIKEAASQLGINPATIRRWLLGEHRVKVRGDGRKREVELQSCAKELEYRELVEASGVGTVAR